MTPARRQHLLETFVDEEDDEDEEVPEISAKSVTYSGAALKDSAGSQMQLVVSSPASLAASSSSPDNSRREKARLSLE